MEKFVSRRDFLQLLGLTFGSGALIKTGSALGMLPQATAVAQPDTAQLGRVKRRVAILGGGISGLTAAYELMKAGHEVTVLEASHRAGGRVFTVRHGDLIDEIGNRQYCEFDDEPHLYFNAGAARIPSTHRSVLRYCRELGVELELFINENKTAYFQDDGIMGGRPIRNAEYSTNVRGFLAELFSKSLTQAELDGPFAEGEIESLLEIIRSFGDLSEDLLYKGSLRAGYASGGFLDHGTQKDMIAFRDLMQSEFVQLSLTANEGETGPVLMQPVGGMDMIIKGFLRQLGDRVKYRAPVTAITIKDDGVDVVYGQDGARELLQVDTVFNCIPSHLLTGIPNNFPTEYLQAMEHIRRGRAYKAAFQARTRFWEDEDIYGGITWVNAPIRQIWYPPHGIHKEKGIVLAAYDFVGGMHFTNMTQGQRIEALLQQGEKVHPDYRQQVEKGITIAWHRINHMLGCAARWTESYRALNSTEEAMMATLVQPANGRHYFIGDQVSTHVAWQESAIQSTHRALADFAHRLQSTATHAA
ncbi:MULTISPECIES: FAD-dependent oxidoreductase [unclassified Microbulbifer]|uniref:flavin monoamine oxidase family protein n=1 Tax=unclassified Microbulbifer TaxID=2619833 RepID=UPI0027E5884F|nr:MULTISPECIES: FAD-dependent oxidoreductase [unclassified Microbulbifer]